MDCGWQWLADLDRFRRLRVVTDDLALFGDDARARATAPVAEPTPIADWQRDLIRRALDARHLTSMEDRQQAVEAAAGRTVSSLRDLTHDEAIRVLNRLGESAQGGERPTSLWESRDEATWLDRM